MNKRRQLSIPVVAMSDIAFLLLIFLMLTNLNSSNKTAHITLPKTEFAQKVTVKKKVVICVSKDAEYYLDDRKKTLEELKQELRTKSRDSINTVVFILGDQDTEFQAVDKVIKVLQAESLRNCVFVTKKIQPAN